jgi:hypothetical protein
MFDFDAFATTYTMVLRNERAPLRPTFTPPPDPMSLLSPEQQRLVRQLARRRLEETTLRAGAVADDDAPGGVIAPQPDRVAAASAPPGPIVQLYSGFAAPVIWAARPRQNGAATG